MCKLMEFVALPLGFPVFFFFLTIEIANSGGKALLWKCTEQWE